MNDRQQARHERQVERIIRAFKSDLWIQDWRIHIVHERGGIAPQTPDGGSPLGLCRADWRYLEAGVTCNCAALGEVDKEELERVLLHELLHAVVNEMREWEGGDGLHHEERVVTHLTNVIHMLKSAGGA